ncbi:MAG TPA: xanthine dehydrogenase family protein subunit M [Candidatus Limnocylindrales bacterium]|nr:xanthine dehydrogenase family protein subunit M [Candidatus Limnocylindrales bacterium]
MIPARFDYVRPPDLEGALRILAERAGEAKVLAGGYSLVPVLKLRLAEPALLVDLRDVGGLDGIVETDDDIRIGARATHRRILEDPRIAERLPLFAEAAAGIGDPQVRNWGTIGGSVAHADPSGDWPAVLLAARASIVCRRLGGERVVPARDFFVDSFVTALDPTEIVVEIRVPRPGPRSGGAYEKLERRAGDFATVGCAVQLELADDGRIARSGIGLTAVAPAPFAATEAEAILDGAGPSDELFRRAGQAAADRSSPASDAHGPADYKRAMVAELTARALRRAVARARGEATGGRR